MARLIIENMTLEQAKQLADFYASYGEQIADEWLDGRGIRAPFTDSRRGVQVEGDTVTLYCRDK